VFSVEAQLLRPARPRGPNLGVGDIQVGADNELRALVERVVTRDREQLVLAWPACTDPCRVNRTAGGINLADPAVLRGTTASGELPHFTARSGNATSRRTRLWGGHCVRWPGQSLAVQAVEVNGEFGGGTAVVRGDFSAVVEASTDPRVTLFDCEAEATATSSTNAATALISAITQCFAGRSL
jgi:hypothetical protein